MKLRFKQNIYMKKDKNGKLVLVKEGKKTLQYRQGHGFGIHMWYDLPFEQKIVEVQGEQDLKYYE